MTKKQAELFVMENPGKMDPVKRVQLLSTIVWENMEAKPYVHTTTLLFLIPTLQKFKQLGEMDKFTTVLSQVRPLVIALNTWLKEEEYRCMQRMTESLNSL